MNINLLTFTRVMQAKRFRSELQMVVYAEVCIRAHSVWFWSGGAFIDASWLRTGT